MDREELFKNMTKKQKDFYEKMMPYEKGQYHQCIPNPDPEALGEMITV